MSFDGRAIANFVLDHCDSQGRSITNLSLQKIVYFCHVWSLIELGRPLVRQEFEAWQFGPVLQYVYREFKAFDRSPIKGRATSLDAGTGEMKVVDYKFDQVTRDLLVRIVNFYSRLSASQLVELSHANGGPWERAWNHKGNVNPGMKIENERIVEFYRKAQTPQSIQ